MNDFPAEKRRRFYNTNVDWPSHLIPEPTTAQSTFSIGPASAVREDTARKIGTQKRAK